jgi:hypothetical protein
MGIKPDSQSVTARGEDKPLRDSDFIAIAA